ncbi:hypothetical protein [Lacticaseibacillus sp. N501-2]|uniref:hypothetical protein n=1 Tax=Lacticaseibacillus salsurae TaxID=3367729 RepID=UPI0038B408F4
MLIALIDILIFVITAGLLVTIIARIPSPLNLVTGLLTTLVLTLIAGAMFTWHSTFMILYILWMLAIIAALFGLRYWLRKSHATKH